MEPKTCYACGDPVGQRNSSGMCRRCYKSKHRKSHREEAKASVKRWQAENPEKTKSYKKKWQAENPDKAKASVKKYCKAHREEANAAARKWNEANPVRKKVSTKKWREANLEETKAYWRKWYAENTDNAKAAVKKWRDANPERVRELHHDRRIYLSEYADCKKLNNIFPGCHAHHIDTDTIMHIPASLHNAVRHSLKTGQGMGKMNQLSHDWLNGVRMDSPQATLEAFI